MTFLSREEGHAAVEYALTLTLMAMVVIAVMALLGPAIGSVFSHLHGV